ncbi:MAG: N-acetyltransferase [Proteobacteria bacterium]|nr:N-acetyltransferase [Pseudomonadota bacterium]
MLPFPRFRIPFHRPAELRIDVDPSAKGRGESLETLHERIHSPGDPLHGLPGFGLHDPQFKVHIREADGEFYAYVEDLQRHCLAGCTVFNRLVEVDRNADLHLRSPHSRYLAQYQRRGIATAVYEWALSSGICLMTGARQSAGAHALWRSLAQRYESGFADLRGKKLSYLGREIGAWDLNRLETRMFLLRRETSLAQFGAAVGMLHTPRQGRPRNAPNPPPI